MTDFLTVSLFVIFLFIIISLSSFGAVWFYTRWAHKKSILDIPNQRSSHTQVTPRGGGFGFLAIFFIFFLAMAYALSFVATAVALVGVALVLAMVGAIDDLKGLPAKVRIVFHFIVAGLGVYIFMSEPYYLNMGILTLKAPFLVFTFLILFSVWMINLYNFMDGIDGIAAGQVISVSLATLFFANKYLLDVDDSTRGLVFIFYSIALAAACFGFLIMNWPPAKVFMGDVGSSVLGFLLAAQAIWGSQEYGVNFSVFLVLNTYFIGDATYTLLIRAFRRIKVWEAHKSHLYQRLDQKGISRKKYFYC